MIASFSRNFIFIKTRKTGGTSIEIVLSGWCSGNDICTTITGKDELIRYGYGSAAMNFCEDQSIVEEFNRLVKRGNASEIQKYRQRIRPTLQFRNHMTASRVRSLLPELWDKALKFTIDRHPYEKVVSKAWWQMKASPSRHIADALDHVIAEGSFLNYPLYTDGGKVIVDEVVPYETMWERIKSLQQEFGAPEMREIPRAKASTRADRRPAHDVLSRDQKRRVLEAAAFEFELLGYQP